MNNVCVDNGAGNGSVSALADVTAQNSGAVGGANFGGRSISAPRGGGKITMRLINQWIAFFAEREREAKLDLDAAGENSERAEALRRKFEILQALVKMFNDFATLFVEKFAETLQNCFHK
ncbi:MAG: hypothetical protein LBI61_03495 [Puniceicoccales bacterium]|jgi:hypothetical protein|nr:hypothetical protein [Puniceicoccales bacterium]